MKTIIAFGFFVIMMASASTINETRKDDGPEYLDMLLETMQYDKFSEVTGIHRNLVHFHHNNSYKSTPDSLEGIVVGDIILDPKRKEQDRQGETYRTWSDKKIYYAISKKFSAKSRKMILKSINHWNDVVDCIKWEPHFEGQKDYVMFLIGGVSVCQSNLGHTGGMQPLYLDEKGCMTMDTILHEMDHAIGVIHEHNRKDRDTYVEVLWGNIPKSWRNQYFLDDSSTVLGDYDYYSFMHYFYLAPDAYKKPAFKILTPGIDTDRIGLSPDFTENDLKKISKLYCD